LSSQPSPSTAWALETERIGRQVLVYDQLPSTNSLAAELATSLPEGTVLIAQQQTAGRGRYGRVWQSRPGSSLLMSVILRPPPALRRPSVMTAWAAVAVGDAIFRLARLQARIKWPNDLLIRGKKVCGILIEQGHGGTGEGPRTIVGIGLNLNQSAEEFLDAELPDAASLSVFTSGNYELRSAAEVVLRCLDSEYSRLLANEIVAVEADWKWRIGLLGKDVMVERTDGSTIAGRLREMSFESLELEQESVVPLLIPPESVAHIWAIS